MQDFPALSKYHFDLYLTTPPKGILKLRQPFQTGKLEGVSLWGQPLQGVRQADLPLYCLVITAECSAFLMNQ
mgnify:FL=1